MVVLDFTGAVFEVALPFFPINLSVFAAQENFFVKAMIEPTIKFAGTASIIKKPAAILRRLFR